MSRKRPARRGKDPKPKKQVTFSLTYKGEEYSSPNPVPEDLVCPICHELLDEPQQTTHCGHIFCKKCLMALIQSNGPQTVSLVITGRLHKQPIKCPNCRTSCEGWFEDKSVNRKVRNVEVFCSNPSCEWKGSLCHLDDHKSGRGCQGCQYEPVSCTSRCGEKVIRKDLEDHKQNTCVLRPKNCGYCQWLGTHKSMNNHYLKCQKYPIPCPNNCGKKNIPVQEVEGHLQECPEREIECSYSNLGCKDILKRSTSDDHCEHSIDAHMHLLKCRVSLLTQAFIEGQRVGGPSNVASSSSQSDPLSLVSRPWLENTKLFPSIPWIIRFDQFSKKKAQPGVKWTSDPFFTTPTGYKLCLQVNPDGYKEENKGHISVFTVLKRGPNDEILSWPFDKTVKVTLLNQLKDRHHYSKLTAFKDVNPEFTRIKLGAKSATGWGRPRFITHGDLDKKLFRNCQYLKDNCLFFKIELQ